MKRSFVGTLLLAILLQTKFAQAESYAPKLTLRTGAGSMENLGTSGGKTSTTGGFNLVVTQFLTPKLSAGFGYRADFDLQKRNMPLWGYDLSGRFYYLGSGAIRKNVNEWSEIESHDSLSLYVGMDYSKREYFFGVDTEATLPNTQLKGDFSAGVFTTGVDYRLSEKFEFNGELSQSLLVFSASDTRFRVSTTMISFGLTYIFN